MEATINTLKKAGLKDREANIYLALLQLGPASVLAIAKKANEKRPICYVVLDELVRKGLVSLVPNEKKKLYMALSPENLIDMLKDRTVAMQKLLPELLAFYKGQADKPFVQMFESGEGMLNVYRDITSRKDIKEVLAFYSFEAIPKEFDENYDLFIKLYREKHVRGRELISSTSQKHFYLDKVKNLPNYQARFSSTDFLFTSDTAIYGDKVAIFSFKKHFALIIESKDVAMSFRSLFELAWESAKAI